MANREDLNAEAVKAGVENPESFETKAELQAAIDAKQNQTEETTPSEQAADDIEKSGVQGLTEGDSGVDGNDPSEPDAQSDGANDEDQTVPAQADGIDGVDRDHTPAGTTDEANSETEAADRLVPPVAANGLSPEATDEAYEANNQVNPAATAAEVSGQEAESNTGKEETRRAEAKAVETELGTSEEEAAAARAGVQAERLNDPKQNREPKNEFEQSNQKVTEEERQAAQAASDKTSQARVEESPTPAAGAATDAARSAESNQGSEIAQAITQGMKEAKKGNTIKITTDKSVVSRFSIVRSKSTGEVMLRENETGVLSKIQLESIEEREASIQGQEVEEVR
jgi:hypothetical protein